MQNGQRQHLRSVPSTETVAPYNFSARVEQDAVFHAVETEEFWARLGRLLEPDALRDPVARLVLTTATAIVAEGANYPGGMSAIESRLHVLSDQGKVTDQQRTAVAQYFVSIEERGPATYDKAGAAVIPVLKRRQQQALIENLMQTHMGRGDVTELAQRLIEVESIGFVSLDMGMELGPGVFERIDRLRHIEKLPYGIHELDSAMGGGMGRSQLCVFMGKAGDGKSMALTNVAASALCRGLNVVTVSLELEEEPQTARLLANLTGVPTDKILGGSWETASQVLTELQAHEGFGTYTCKWFAPQVSTLSEIRLWLEHVKSTRDIHVIVVDYADKIGTNKRDEKSYTAMRDVYEGLRLLAVEWSCWVFTASQKKAGTQKADLDSMADSMHKSRVTDVAIDLEAQDDGDMMMYRVLKNRHGRSRFEIGPEPTAFEFGRISALDKHVAQILVDAYYADVTTR